MMVDAHCARSGLSHKTNMASSLSLGGSLSFENGMLKAKVTAPPRRETIIDASYVSHGFMDVKKGGIGCRGQKNVTEIVNSSDNS